MANGHIAGVSHLLAARAEELCHSLLPEGSRQGAEWRVGNVAGEPGQSLGVRLTGPKAGRWRDFATDESGDPIDLIKAVRRVDTAETLRWAKAWLGIEQARSGARETRATQGDTKKRRPQSQADNRGQAARDIWRAARAAEGTPVEAYLRSRGITIAIPPSIRYALALKHTPTGLYFPALVAAVTIYPSKRVVAIQRTFLRPDGLGKANVLQPRMSLGLVAGGAVRLAPAGTKLAVGEGVEDGLAVRQAEPDLPVWATLGTSGLRGVILPPLPMAAEAIILGDADKAGEAAAQDAARRFIAEGRRVSIARPRGCKDFNDLLRPAA